MFRSLRGQRMRGSAGKIHAYQKSALPGFRENARNGHWRKRLNTIRNWRGLQSDHPSRICRSESNREILAPTPVTYVKAYDAIRALFAVKSYLSKAGLQTQLSSPST